VLDPRALQLVAIVAGPAGALWLTRTNRLAHLLGPVLLCYALGIALGNTLPVDVSLSLSASEGAVALGIPLLLVSSDVRRWAKLARPTLLSFTLACISAMAASMATGLLFRSHSEEWWKMAGMLVGVYTGGTANMSAVGLALGVREETFILLNGADVLAGAAYLLFLMTSARRLLQPFFPRSPSASPFEESRGGDEVPRARARHVLLALGYAVLTAGLCAGAVVLLSGRLEAAPMMLGLTTAGIGASLLRPLRELPATSRTGEYVLLCFCVGIGTLADVRQFGASSGVAMGMVFSVMLGAVVLHLLLASLFRLDMDTVLITSTATIFGPPFIGPVARALDNRDLVATGLTAGLMGYALGSYLGLAAAWLLALSR
jgi:uncharacterized membrane protein